MVYNMGPYIAIRAFLRKKW